MRPSRLIFCLCRFALVLYLVDTVRCVSSDFSIPSSDEMIENKEEGERQLAIIRDRAADPRYGQCWSNALSRVQASCKRLTDDEQSFLAFSFTICHLAKADIRIEPCYGPQTISQCLTKINNNAIVMNAYTEFFTHMQNICFFLQSALWHEKTEATVSRLANSSEVVALQLEESSQVQQRIVEIQNTSLTNQQQILDNGRQLTTTLKNSSDELLQIFAEIHRTTDQHTAKFNEIFGLVSGIERTILGEFTWFWSLGFYLLASGITYMVTSAPRTAAARLWVFLILFVNILVERAIVSMTTTGVPVETVYVRMSYCRSCFCLLAVLVCATFALLYKDYNAINNRLLVDIRQQNEEIKQVLLLAGVKSDGVLGGNLAIKPPMPYLTVTDGLEGSSSNDDTNHEETENEREEESLEEVVAVAVASGGGGGTVSQALSSEYSSDSDVGGEEPSSSSGQSQQPDMSTSQSERSSTSLDQSTSRQTRNPPVRRRRARPLTERRSESPYNLRTRPAATPTSPTKKVAVATLRRTRLPQQLGNRLPPNFFSSDDDDGDR